MSRVDGRHAGGMPRGSHLSLWIFALSVVLLLVYGWAFQLARAQATSDWDEIGGAFGDWLHVSPVRIRGVRQVVPASARRLWSGLEGTISWPAHRQEAEGSLLHAHREIGWLQKNRDFSVLVWQDRHWLAVQTRVRFSGGNAPPRSLVRALRRVLGEDGVEVLVEP